ncbi:MAG: hypothetical protein PUB07_00645 [Clostridia bacterium]|nr:hypothetical protein [Clostridia bacterium]
MFFNALISFLLGVTLLGIISHFVGEALPRGLFFPDKFPYAFSTWEKNGKFYQKISIRRWKRYLPDKSHLIHSMVKKSLENGYNILYMQQLLKETCVAECMHDCLLLLSPLFALYIQRPWGTIFAVLYAVSHLPCILVQRYNRMRLLRVIDHKEMIG